MNLFGLELRRPTFWEITLTAAGCTLLLVVTFIACLAFGYVPDTATKIVFSVSLAWGSLCNVFGVRVLEGGRHVLLLLGGCVLFNLVALALADAIQT